MFALLRLPLPPIVTQICVPERKTIPVGKTRVPPAFPAESFTPTEVAPEAMGLSSRVGAVESRVGRVG